MYNGGKMINTNIIGIESRLSSLQATGRIDRELGDLLSEIVTELKDLNRKVEENENRFKPFM